MAARRPKDISAWLSGNRGTVQSGSSNETQIDTGGGERDKVNETLAIGLAGAAGLTAAGVALNRSGVLARAKNAVTGKTILIHGSSNKIVGKNINPSLASEYFGAPIKPAVFGWNPKGFTGMGNDREQLIDSIRAYGKKDIAIGVVKKNTLMPYETNLNLLQGMENARVRLKFDDMIISESPVPIKKILTNPSDTELIKAIKRAGGKVPKKR